ncbi:MAG: type II secretion system GspH family protein [Candidatus Pacebacteria bacterium]|nr:type II secretion system GspH family protein [Candidatus Paceibacterota bacterium]
MKFKNSSKGFTLIELLVVIAIIGILSSVVLASMNTARKKARDARRQADLKSLQLALESYYDTHSAYPVAAAEGDVSTTLSALTSGGMITALPSDPSSSQTYRYRTDATGSEYCLGANMEQTPPTPADTCPTTKVTGGGADYMTGQ